MSHVVIHFHDYSRLAFVCHRFILDLRNKQVDVLLILVKWTLKQLEVNGATDYGNRLSIVLTAATGLSW